VSRMMVVTMEAGWGRSKPQKAPAESGRTDRVQRRTWKELQKVADFQICGARMVCNRSCDSRIFTRSEQLTVRL